jgi:hypothetical protein
MKNSEQDISQLDHNNADDNSDVDRFKNIF